MLSAPLAAFVALAALALQGCRKGQPGNDPPHKSWPIGAGTGRTPFVKYPGYTGSLEVEGLVWIGEADTGVQSIWVSLSGVDPNCTGYQSGQGNVCGMHIHSGTTCSTGTGGHYFAGESDPWVPVTYTDPDQGSHVVSGDQVVATGYSLDQLENRTFVVHDRAGTRVACAQLLAGPKYEDNLKVENFVKYTGSDTSLAVAGSVSVMTPSDGLRILPLGLRFQLTGADPSCTPDAEITSANGCGIHIHEGTSCDSPAGGHYYDDWLSEDPWEFVTYRNEVSNGVTYPIATDIQSNHIEGRVVVVHDFSGARIACGVIEAVNRPPSTSASGDEDEAQAFSASARGDEDEAQGASLLVWAVSAALVVASLGGGAWFYQSQRRGYATQQDESTEMQNAATQQDQSAEVNNAAAKQDDLTEMQNAA